MVNDECIVVIDTDVDNATYDSNDDGTHINFNYTFNNLYHLYIGINDEEQSDSSIKYRGYKSIIPSLIKNR